MSANAASTNGCREMRSGREYVQSVKARTGMYQERSRFSNYTGRFFNRQLHTLGSSHVTNDRMTEGLLTALSGRHAFGRVFR